MVGRRVIVTLLRRVDALLRWVDGHALLRDLWNFAVLIVVFVFSLWAAEFLCRLLGCGL